MTAGGNRRATHGALGRGTQRAEIPPGRGFRVTSWGLARGALVASIVNSRIVPARTGHGHLRVESTTVFPRYGERATERAECPGMPRRGLHTLLVAAHDRELPSDRFPLNTFDVLSLAIQRREPRMLWRLIADLAY